MNESDQIPASTPGTSPELALKYPHLGGWKTWLAAAGLGILGAVDLIEGDLEAALTKLSTALGLIGIGHKIQKAGLRGGMNG